MPPPRIPDAAPPAAAAAAAKFSYNPALDGLRAIAIFLVLAGHMGAVRASNVAVDTFFVLSGFLITALMLAEVSRTGTVSISRFLVRRAYRLMPAASVYLAVGLAVTIAFKWDDVAYRQDYFRSAVSTLVSVNNWFRIGNPQAGGRWLGHVWSLSIEEQFYLLWPVLFVAVLRIRPLRDYLVPITIVMIIAAVAWSCIVAYNGASRLRVYFGLDTHAVPLLLGCLLAVCQDRRPRTLAGGRLAALGLPAGIGLVVLAFVGPDKADLWPNWLDRTGYLPSAVLAAIVILACDLHRDASWVRLLGGRRIAWAGKIAYGIFLWHYPVISAAGRLVPHIGLWPSVVVAAVVSTILGALSSRFIERPVQNRRPRWADAPRGPAASASATQLSLGGTHVARTPEPD